MKTGPMSHEELLKLAERAFADAECAARVLAMTDEAVRGRALPDQVAVGALASLGMLAEALEDRPRTAKLDTIRERLMKETTRVRRCCLTRVRALVGGAVLLELARQTAEGEA